jgi:hypothetical protein
MPRWSAPACDDVLVEPRRAPLIAGFAAVKQAALDAGAMGASISGAGPSVFAWFEDRGDRRRPRRDAMPPRSPRRLRQRRPTSRPVAGPARGARMKALSTRGIAPPVAMSQAIAAGLAPDGGLYMPEHWPMFPPSRISLATRPGRVGTRCWRRSSPTMRSARGWPAICADAFAVRRRCAASGPRTTFVLELFHGPTAAFKDYGARFLAALLARCRRRRRR